MAASQDHFVATVNFVGHLYTSFRHINNISSFLPSTSHSWQLCLCLVHVYIDLTKSIWDRFGSFLKACLAKSNCSLVNKHRKLHCSIKSNKSRESDINLFMSDRAALTSARTTGNGIYCPPKLQASLDQQSGMIRLFLIVVVKCYDSKYIILIPASRNLESEYKSF